MINLKTITSTTYKQLSQNNQDLEHAAWMEDLHCEFMIKICKHYKIRTCTHKQQYAPRHGYGVEYIHPSFQGRAVRTG